MLEGNICALLAAKDHVNVFVYDGAIVPDPEGIITAGHDNKTARTVAIPKGETINAPALRAMFKHAPLVDLLGSAGVAAIDPSAPFVAAVKAGLPDVDVRTGKAEDLRFPDDGFDAALAHLVVHFMSDPVAGLRGMARVTRPAAS